MLTDLEILAFNHGTDEDHDAIIMKKQSATNTRDDLIHLLADLTGQEFWGLYYKILLDS